MKICAYEIVDADSPIELEKRVQIYMEGGWQPQGGVAVLMYVVRGSDDERRWWYAQAMVKYEQSVVML